MTVTNVEREREREKTCTGERNEKVEEGEEMQGSPHLC